jgi:uncharacterized protein
MTERGILLDVNVLLALFWPPHEFHHQVRGWFRDRANKQWATCPITQNGFVRIASNPAFSRDALSVDDALRLLKANLSHPGHVFWPDDLDLTASLSLSGARLQGHRQITDAYLLGLAMHHKGRLATLDNSVATLLPRGSRTPDWIIDLSTASHRS